MTWVGADEIVKMRQEAQWALSSLCTIGAPTRTQDDTGGGTISYTSTTLVPCRLSPVNSAERGVQALAGAAALHAPWMLTLKYDAGIVAGNRVTLNSDTYQVVQVLDDHDDRIFRRAYLRRVE